MRLLLLVLLALQGDRPQLATRVFPQMQTFVIGGACQNATRSNVILTAEIKGEEAEAWYCPKVEWTLPNGTQASEESDCDPWDEHEDYPRLWRRPYCAGPDVGDGQTAVVSLIKNDSVIARAEIRFFVK